MLAYTQQHVNKILRKVTTKYKFKFVGYEPEDEEKKESIKAKQLNTRKSIDDLRKEDGDEPFNEAWSKMPLNPQAVQIYLGKQAGGFGPGFGGGEETGEGEEEKEFTGEESEQEMEKSFRKLTDRKERQIRYTIE